jgi:hypothetical protein
LRTGSHQLDSPEILDGTPTERFQSWPRYLKIVGESISSGNQVAKSQLQLFLELKGHILKIQFCLIFQLRKAKGCDYDLSRGRFLRIC